MTERQGRETGSRVDGDKDGDFAAEPGCAFSVRQLKVQLQLPSTASAATLPFWQSRAAKNPERPENEY